ncbi:hypothetical protein ACP70R_005848 [Stipagrostis hirtigluma subsp. patula]
MAAAAVTLRRVMLASAALRLALVVFGEWQDAHLEVRYTDVDYLVFSDAAASVAAGGSPFARATYRYSPLLAFLLVPNSLLHAAWGKLIFSAADLLVGLFIDTILKLRGIPEKMRMWSVVAWLFNPFTFTIGTRGNCEPIVCAIILWILICLMKGRVLQAAFWYGLIVHFRIYPIIYAIPFVIVLGKNYAGPTGRPILTLWSSKKHLPNEEASQSEEPTSFLASLWNSLSSFMTRNAILFGLLSVSMFFAWTGVFFYLYGWDFLNEALLYHLTRTDPRHNFSIYFYHIYLHHQQGFSSIQRLASFLPQLIVQLALILRFSRDLPFCMFLQTVAFVAFNKGDDSAVLCVVLLPVAAHPSLDQYETQVEGSGLHASVDGISTALAHVGLPTGIQGPKRIRTALGCRSCVSGGELLYYDHDDQAPQVHSALLVVSEVWKQGCYQEGIASLRYFHFAN